MVNIKIDGRKISVAAGNYEISLDVVNTYTNKNTPNGAGNKERLVFNYNGAVEAY